MITTARAKSIIKNTLVRHKLSYTKLTAKTVHFSSLGAGSCIFVRVHGWQKGPAWTILQDVAKEHGFCVET